jgi:hypothetical protein
LILFEETVDELFCGSIAANAKSRANNIARILKSVKKYRCRIYKLMSRCKQIN